MIVIEYEAKFMELAKFVSRLVKKEHDRVYKLERELKTKIRKKVVPYKLIYMQI